MAETGERGETGEPVNLEIIELSFAGSPVRRFARLSFEDSSLVEHARRIDRGGAARG